MKKNILSKKLILIFLLGFLNFSFGFVVFAQSNNTTIRIISAENTQYKKNEQSGDDEIILNGSVSISVSKGSSTTTITADSVTYNRATDMIYANGNITLKQSGSSSGDQNISADSLLFNTSTLEGIFDNGRVIQTQSDAINLPSGSTLIVASDIFGRDSSGTIDFKNAELTFCDDENPHWKIRASNIWLLPGGEFAFFNAVLTIGSIPLLYLPAFYYPKDELIFNPSFGYHERKGYYFQTTTYLYGRKPLNAESSSNDEDDITAGLFNFMKSTTLKEQVREGLVLHNLDTDYTGDTTNYFKIMGDYYTNLGGMVGFEGVYKPSKYISNIQGNLNLGFSNTIFESSSQYIPYSQGGKIYSDSSNFMGLELPFRYSGNFQFSMTRPFSFSLSMPFYSDPYFKDDFGERSEYIDWIGFLMSSSENDDSTNTVSSFTWTASASYTVPLPDFIKPYISSFAISSVKSELQFSSKARTFVNDEVNSKIDSQDVSSWKSYTPERYFYYPSQVTPLTVSGRLSGTLVSISSSSSSSRKVNTPNFTVNLDVPEEFLTEEEKAKLEEEKLKLLTAATAEDSSGAENSAAQTEDASQTEDVALAEDSMQTENSATLAENLAQSENSKSEEEKTVLTENDLPLLTSNDSSSITQINGINYNLSYTVSPVYTSQITYNASSLTNPNEFDWKNVYSTYYQIKVPATLTSKLSYRDSFASMSNVFTFNPVFQAHPNLDGYTESAAATVKLTDYNAKKLDLTNTNSVSVKPFLYTSIFKNTSLDWNTSIKLIRTEFIGDVDNPEWEYTIPKSLAELDDADTVTTHTLSGTLSAVQGNFSQVLTLSTTLPPQTDEYVARLSLTFPFVTLNFGGGIEQKSKDSEDFVLQPFQQSASVKLFNSSLTFTESFNLELEDTDISDEDIANGKSKMHPESLKIALSYKNLQLAYTASYTKSYNFDVNSGYTINNSDIAFRPYSASLAYSTSSKTFKYWFNRISFAPSLSTSIVWDFIRPAYSYFRFVPSITFKINDFLDLKFSAESRNSVIFRYVQKYLGYEGAVAGETNPLVDLFNSFKFWDDENFYDPNQTARKSSGYKLKNLSVTLNHNLCDWDLASTLTFKPRSTTDDSGRRIYSYSPYFSVSVTWRPMSSLKTQIVDEYGEWKLNP